MYRVLGIAPSNDIRLSESQRALLIRGIEAESPAGIGGNFHMPIWSADVPFSIPMKCLYWSLRTESATQGVNLIVGTDTGLLPILPTASQGLPNAET